MNRFVVMVSLVSLIGCSKTNPTGSSGAAPSANTPPPAASNTSPPAAAGLPSRPSGFDAKAKLKDGRVIEYNSAIVYQYKGSSTLHLVASTDKVTCAYATNEDGPTVPEGQDRVEIVVAPVLRPDGTSPPAVMQAFHLSGKGTESGAVGKYADVRLVGEDPSKEVRATVSGWKAERRVELDLEGTIVAEGCGAVKGPEQAEDAPKSRPQSKLSLEVAKKKIDVNGAIYRPTRNIIVLSSRALDCSTTAIEDEVTLNLADDGEVARFFGFGVEEVDKAHLDTPAKIEIGKAAGGFLPTKINGKFTLGAYPVVVSGSAELLSCD